jgi:hypothetical protein
MVSIPYIYIQRKDKAQIKKQRVKYQFLLFSTAKILAPIVARMARKSHPCSKNDTRVVVAINLIPFDKMPFEDFIEQINGAFMGWYILHQVMSLLWHSLRISRLSPDDKTLELLLLRQQLLILRRHHKRGPTIRRSEKFILLTPYY